MVTKYYVEDIENNLIEVKEKDSEIYEDVRLFVDFEDYKQLRWILVSDRLPDMPLDASERIPVLIFDGEEAAVVLWRKYTSGWDFQPWIGKPICWMPITLPEEQELRK